MGVSLGCQAAVIGRNRRRPARCRNARCQAVRRGSGSGRAGRPTAGRASRRGARRRARTWTRNSSAARDAGVEGGAVAGPGGGAPAARARRVVDVEAAVAPGARRAPASARSSSRLDVGAQLVGGAGQRLGDPGAELGLEHRQHPVRAPGPGCSRGSALCGSSQDSRPSARQAASVSARRDAEQRAREARRRRAACPAATGRPSRGSGRAARSRPGRPGCGRAAPTGAPRLLGDLARGRRTSPRGRPPPAPARRGVDVDPRGQRLVDAQRGHLGDDPVGLLGRAGLQAVVDGHADHAQAQLVALEDGRPRAARASRRRR